MLDNKDSRVLGRWGARELSQEEYDNVSGGFSTGYSTRCTFDPRSGCYDGDCSLCIP